MIALMDVRLISIWAGICALGASGLSFWAMEKQRRLLGFACIFAAAGLIYLAVINLGHLAGS